jgi:hypothetical protein
LRCRRCGNENAEANRFCGMCGAALVVSDAGPDAGPSTGPVITGPSFLGLNTPAGQTGAGRAGLRSDRIPGAQADAGRDLLRPSSNVDYLLEDEEEPRRGWGKLILVVVALALAVGFGYLHWKQGGFDWLTAGDKKPTAATTQAPDSGQSGADSGGTPGTTPTPQAGASGAGMAPAAGAASPETAAGQTTPSQIPSQTPSQAPPSESTSTPSPSQSANQQSADQQSAPQSNAADSSAPAPGAQAAGSGSDEPSPAAEASPGQRAVARKPAAAKLAPAKAVDSVTEAERYIYGRGVRQDCDHGLQMLKPAAEQSNVKAMISLGALYSTGTCTPRDLPTAYRWFALALHKEPDNQVLQDDLQKLWSQMTQPERQLAIRLSQ